MRRFWEAQREELRMPNTNITNRPSLSEPVSPVPPPRRLQPVRSDVRGRQLPPSSSVADAREILNAPGVQPIWRMDSKRPRNVAGIAIRRLMVSFLPSSWFYSCFVSSNSARGPLPNRVGPPSSQTRGPFHPLRVCGIPHHECLSSAP